MPWRSPDADGHHLASGRRELLSGRKRPIRRTSLPLITYQFSCIHWIASFSLNCFSNSYSCKVNTDMFIGPVFEENASLRLAVESAIDPVFHLPLVFFLKYIFSPFPLSERLVRCLSSSGVLLPFSSVLVVALLFCSSYSLSSLSCLEISSSLQSSWAARDPLRS